MNIQFLLLTIFFCIIIKHECLDQDFSPTNIITINERSSIGNVRLKSVLSLKTANSKTQKIFWSFKRVYNLPILSGSAVQINQEISQNEMMISLDSEVEENLKDKYSIDSEQSDLIIHNLTYSDSGIYKCNLWNQKTIYYNLIVSSPITKPVIDLADKTPIQESNDVIIKCASKFSYPYPVFKWYKNDIEMPNLNFKLVDKETNLIESSYRINNINSTFHMNNFTCKLTQELNDEKLNKTEKLWQLSDVLRLNVAYKPIVNLHVYSGDSKLPDLKENNNNNNKLYLYNESDVVFKCKYNANPVNDGSLKIKWILNNNIESETSDSFIWNNRSNLVAKQMNLTCQVSNSIGMGFYTYDISVLYEPRITSDRSIYDVDESNHVQIQCRVDSFPQPEFVEWRKYDLSESLSEKNYKVISNSSVLDFKSIKHTDNAGFYTCVTANSMKDSFGVSRQAEKSLKIEINVRFMPFINVINKKIAANLTISANQTSLTANLLKHNISCMTMANPRPNFSWYRDGVKLNTSSSFSSKYRINNLVKSKNLYENILIINDLNEFDLNKKYECEATNPLGTNKLEVELVPLSKPYQPTELRTLYVDFMSITLSWQAGFDGGLDQTFIIEINNTVVDLDQEQVSVDKIVLNKYGPTLLNITNVNYNTLYSIRIMAKNKLGNSDWSNFIMIRTGDLTSVDVSRLPVFDSLFLNVPKNRLEYKMKQNIESSNVSSFQSSNYNIPVCFRIYSTYNSSNKVIFESVNCLPLTKANLEVEQFSFDNFNPNELVLKEYITKKNHSHIFKSKLVKSIKVSICFQVKDTICTAPPTSAIIDTYNKISHSSLLTSDLQDINSLNFNNRSVSASSIFLHNNSSIPVALIIGICVCISTLLILLFFSVIYCIRKRNFKLCKVLLSPMDNNLNGMNTGNIVKPTDSEKLKALAAIVTETDRKTHTNKSFNIDIASISAPMASTISINGSQLTNSTCSDIKSLNALCIGNGMNSISNRRTFTAALTATASNIIGKNKITEILVTEDEEKQQNILNLNTKQLLSQEHNLNIQSEDLSHENMNGQVSSSNTSSTAVSNSSSLAISNNVPSFIYTDYNPFDHVDTNGLSNMISQQQHLDLFNKGLKYMDRFNSETSASTGSNSDPIAINNSLSSNSTTDSPTYGYNVASATNAAINQNNNDDYDTDNLLYLKKSQNNQFDLKQNSKNNASKTNTLNQYNNHYNQHLQNLVDQPESGYSTPSRPKKVVYEVIV